ncbi:DNA/RNA helicase domain-containing protein [Agrococcus citreus]|uniref:GIY-YIG domain-containing protein n=1 Tax=Agrococcus citreus TaxID=84643 RepID=A0ABP4JID4_9MICO
MPSIHALPFDDASIRLWAQADPRATNWPVVYTLEGGSEVYVGETLNMAARARQHLANGERARLERAHVVVDETFHKSACLDLESYLIRLFSGDAARTVLNRNTGIVNAEYYQRPQYQAKFDAIFEELRSRGLFTRSIPEIRNSDLFKLSPFKALTDDQAAATVDIVESLFHDIEAGIESTSIVQGNPGTGKTIVAIYLVKLLADIASQDRDEEPTGESVFDDFFTHGHRDLLASPRIGLVIPQQSLRASIRRVFEHTPNLDPAMVLSPFQVGHSLERFDVLVVDEAHRLSQRAAQAVGVQTRDFRLITERLFGADDHGRTQLDWIEAQADHRILMLDELQSVRPADLPASVVGPLVARAEADARVHRLATQMRVAAGSDYVAYIRDVLSGEDERPQRPPLGEYDLRFFEDASAMRAEILQRDEEVGLSRLLAGYAWKWRSNKDRAAPDIELDGLSLQWNRTATEWIRSKTSRDEVGSIHTVQGYDLNYAGVLIGRDLGWDAERGRVVFRREHYFDARGKANNNIRGISYSDEDLRTFVLNIYAVLLTRGMLGTYVHVVDPELRAALRPYFSSD